MDDSTIRLLAEVLGVAFLVGLNGFFVAAEFAIVRSHPTKLRGPESSRTRGTKSSLRLIEELDLSLSATQLGITIASLLLGWWGEHTFQRIFYSAMTWMSPQAATVASHALATTLALVLISFLHVVIGELAAKSLAIRYPEQTLRILARPMLLFCVFLRPVIYLLNESSVLFLRLFGVDAPAESERVHSLAELAMLVSQSSRSGLLDKHEEALLKGVFGFSDTIAREVMTPRTDVVTVPASASLDEVVAIAAESGNSRFPVVGERIDDVQGILLIRDILPYFADVSPALRKPFSVADLMREPYLIPGTKPIDDLLNEFKHRKLHLAIVIDEHGGVDGVVTLEDIIEEIVGDIFDESDEPESTIVVEETGDIKMDGGVLVSDVNSNFQLHIPEGDYDTIAGFVFTCLGRLPVEGDTIYVAGDDSVLVNPEDEDLKAASPSEDDTHEESGDMVSDGLRPMLKMVVEEISGHRIETVRIYRQLDAGKRESDSDGSTSEPSEGESS